MYAQTATCSTQTDRNNDATAEDMMTRQAGRRERHRQTLVTGENTPSLSPLKTDLYLCNTDKLCSLNYVTSILEIVHIISLC